MAHLPAREQVVFLADVRRSARGCATCDRWEDLAQVLREWKATAAVYAGPELVQWG